MSNPLKAGPNVSPTIAVAVICLALGGMAGYGARYWREPSHATSASGDAPGGMGAMGKMGMGGGGGGFGGGGGQASPSRDLTSLIRRLGTVEKVSGNELKSDQASKVLTIAERLKSAKKVSDDECKKELEAIDALLTSDQKTALEALQPQRGGGGGGMGKGGMGGMGGGMMAGGPPGKGGMPMGGMGKMGGGGPAPDNPFAEGQGKERIEELIGLLKKKAES